MSEAPDTSPESSAQQDQEGAATEGNPYLVGPRILPRPIRAGMPTSELIRETFLAYNAARLREAARLLAERMLRPEVTVGLSISGALTPAGLGLSALGPLLRGGYVDWVVSTGANLYHDTHFGLGLAMHQGSPYLDDRLLREKGVVRIYDILFDYRVLLSTDAFYREMIAAPPFQKVLSSAEFHALAGKFIRERERLLGVTQPCFLSTAWECGVPVYTSSPGDSFIGMNIAAAALTGNRLTLDPNRDVNETAAIVYDAKRRGQSGVWILGGGSPKSFLLQTEPQIQEVLGIESAGHDYFLQITDARPDTGGLSGSTAAEAVSWGTVDPAMLPHAVVCYLDTTVALPLLTAYVLETVPPRPCRRLYDRRDDMLEALRDAHLRAQVDRQQAILTQKVQETQARLLQARTEIEEKMRETQARVEERVRDPLARVEEKVRDMQGHFQEEINRLQAQLGESVLKLMPQGRQAKKSDDAKKEGQSAE